MPNSPSGTPTGPSNNSGPVTGLAGLQNMETPLNLPEEPYAETLLQEDGTPLPPDPSQRETPSSLTKPSGDNSPAPIDVLEEAYKETTKSTETPQETPTETETPSETQTTTATTPANRRDFTGLPETEHQHWRRMDQRSFDFLAPLRKEHITATSRLAEVEKSLADSAGYRFYQHENAFMLSPEYHQLFQAQQQLSQQADYWQEALTKLDAGEPIQDLVVGKDGSLSRTGQDLEPTPQLRAQVIRLMQNIEARRISAEAETTAFAEKHRNQFKTMTDRIGQATKALLDPMPDTVKAEGEKFLKNFPAEVRHLPEFKALAGAWTFIQLQNAELTKLREQLKVRAAKKKAIASQGPGEGGSGNSTTTTTTTPQDGDKLFANMSALARGES